MDCSLIPKAVKVTSRWGAKTGRDGYTIHNAPIFLPLVLPASSYFNEALLGGEGEGLVMAISSVELPFSQLSSLCGSFLAGMTMTRCAKALVFRSHSNFWGFLATRWTNCRAIALTTSAVPRVYNNVLIYGPVSHCDQWCYLLLKMKLMHTACVYACQQGHEKRALTGLLRDASYCNSAASTRQWKWHDWLVMFLIRVTTQEICWSCSPIFAGTDSIFPFKMWAGWLVNVDCRFLKWVQQPTLHVWRTSEKFCEKRKIFLKVKRTITICRCLH